MEKTATREDVENALNKHLLKDSVYNEILNELFGEPYEPKVGDWVVIGEYNSGSINQPGEVGIVTHTFKTHCKVDCGHNSNANHHNYENLRPATEDEIKRAQWKEGEVYEVWDNALDVVLTAFSSANYGRFKDYKGEKRDYKWDNFKRIVQC